MTNSDLRPWREIARLQVQVEQLATKAKALVRKHTEKDCGCEFCSDMRQAADDLNNVTWLLADATAAEREADAIV